ncbi:Flagellar M-ring protein FliF, partial [hydrothermal vent metagenome]
TVVNQHGDLLSSGGRDAGMGQTSTQFSYNRKLEKTYVDRIQQLLEPVVGVGNVRATVNADLDFTITERTQELYNPDLPALRSEQISEDSSMNSTRASGIPGALSNQPPETGQLQDPAVEEGAEDEKPDVPRNSSKRSVRNYELDKTISHTKLATGTIRRLSIAVIMDNKRELDDNDEPVTKPWTTEELDGFTTLIKDAVGFNGTRGDTMNIINSSFIAAPEAEAVPDPSIMEQPWVWDVAKQAVGALGVLILIFGLLKPILRSLAEKGVQGNAMLSATAGAAGGEDQLSLSGAGAQQAQLEGPKADYEQNLETAKGAVAEDPKRVAQVVKNWVGEDG